MTPEDVRQIIREELAGLLKSDRYTFQKHIQMLDGRNIQLGQTTGTKFGTNALQKIGLYGVTPVQQSGGVTAPTTPGGAYNSGTAQSAVDAINAIIGAIKNIGITS